MTSIGRPRDATVDAKVLAATADLLVRNGYAQLRLDDVVAATGVAKSTIYRRWPSLVHLVVAAMGALLGERRADLTGDPEADLRAVADVALGGLLRAGPSLGALASDLHSQDDPELRAHYRRTLIDPIRQTMIEIVQSGQRSGAFRAEVPPALAVDALIGAAVYRVIVLHEPIDPAELDAALDVVLSGIRA